MRRLLVCCIFLLLANAAEAKHRGPPPAGGEALYRWCRQTVIVKHGWPAPWPDSPHRVVMSARQAVGTIDACVRTHGKIR